MTPEQRQVLRLLIECYEGAREKDWGEVDEIGYIVNGDTGYPPGPEELWLWMTS
jgi:uncharacterized protein (UPF0297 family)